jgi:hypothetical protein
MLANLTRYIQNCAAEERRRGSTPLHVPRVDCSDIPDNAIALATDLGAGKLLPQLFGDEMVFVPELHNSWV